MGESKKKLKTVNQKDGSWIFPAKEDLRGEKNGSARYRVGRVQRIPGGQGA